MLNDILWPDHILWQPPTDQTLYRTRPFTEFWVVSMEHLRRVWHADRGRLLLRTPGPVPLGTCICSTCWDQSFSELVVILPDYALRISLGTFSILLLTSNFDQSINQYFSLTFCIRYYKTKLASTLGYAFLFIYCIYLWIIFITGSAGKFIFR